MIYPFSSKIVFVAIIETTLAKPLWIIGQFSRLCVARAGIAEAIADRINPTLGALHIGAREPPQTYAEALSDLARAHMTSQWRLLALLDEVGIFGLALIECDVPSPLDDARLGWNWSPCRGDVSGQAADIAAAGRCRTVSSAGVGRDCRVSIDHLLRVRGRRIRG